MDRRNTFWHFGAQILIGIFEPVIWVRQAPSSVKVKILSCLRDWRLPLLTSHMSWSRLQALYSIVLDPYFTNVLGCVEIGKDLREFGQN